MVEDVPPPPPGFKMQGEVAAPKEPGFFEPHQEQGTGIMGWAKEFGRGALASTAGVIAHPMNALHGMAQTFSEGVGMTPIAPADAAARREQIMKHPAFTAGSIAAPAVLGMGAKAAAPTIGRVAASAGRGLAENAPAIGKGTGAIAGYEMGHWPGLIAGRYLGEVGGNLVKRYFGEPEAPPPVIVGKMKPGRAAVGGTGEPSPIPPSPPAPVTGKIQPSGEPTGVPPRIPSTPRSTPPDMFEARPVAAHEPTAVASPQVSIPDQIATARNMGFKNLGEAINKFGHEGWQKVLGTVEPKPIAAHEPTIAAPAPEGYQPVQSPQDIRRFRDNLEDQGIKQEMEGEQGPISMVTGRKGGGVSLLPNESNSILGNERLVDLEKGRELAARNSVDQTKGGVMARFQGVAAPNTYADAQAARPLPGASVAANRMEGHPVSQIKKKR